MTRYRAYVITKGRTIPVQVDVIYNNMIITVGSQSFQVPIQRSYRDEIENVKLTLMSVGDQIFGDGWKIGYVMRA